LTVDSGLFFGHRACVFAHMFRAGADRLVYADKDVGVSTTLSVNGRLFISPYEHLDALVFIYLFIYLYIYLYTYLLIYLFIHLFI